MMTMYIVYIRVCMMTMYIRVCMCDDLTMYSLCVGMMSLYMRVCMHTYIRIVWTPVC